MKIKNKKSKLLVLTALAMLLVAGGVYVYSKNSEKKNTVNTPISTEDQINYNPPTDEEKKSGDTAKEKFNEPTNNSGAPDGIMSVKPEITNYGVYQGNVEVSSHVPGILEKSGKCTLRLKKSGETVSQSKTAVPNVSEMSCGLIKIPVSKLSAGTWTATVVYSSVSAKGSSDAVFIEVK